MNAKDFSDPAHLPSGLRHGAFDVLHASLADVAGLPVAPHHMMETTIQVACDVMASAPIEYMPWVAAAFAEPAQIKDGHMLPPQKPGLGLEIPEEVIQRFRVE